MSLTVPRSPFTWCPDCEGKGVRTSADGVHSTCPTCGGQGRLRVKQGPAKAAAPASGDGTVTTEAAAVPPPPAARSEGKAGPSAVRRRAANPVSRARPEAKAGEHPDDTYFLGFARHAATRSPEEGGAALVNGEGVLRMACPGGSAGGKGRGGRKGAATAPLPAHAADQLIALAARHGLATAGASLYLTHPPGTASAGLIIAAGLLRVVVDPDSPVAAPAAERDAVRQMFADEGVELVGMRPPGSARPRG